ncbi:hypothetical protein [Paraburkholderia megapolitana]|uniref:hypothetical protein n=1 Tax=Paraburkholderia megapolitana TaxID=420953 RepID=UPI0038B81349
MTPAGQYGASIGHSHYSPNSPAVARARLIAELGESVVAKMDHIRGITVAAHGALMRASDFRNETRIQRDQAQRSLDQLGDLQRARMRHPDEVAARESALQFATRRHHQAVARDAALSADYQQALAVSSACVQLIRNRIGGLKVDQLISEMEWN